MAERTMTIDESAADSTGKSGSALAQFSYENGYILRGTDLGARGVKIELVDEHEQGAAIIIPPAEAEQCAKWLLETIGQRKYELPRGLGEVLEKITEDRPARQVLSPGDKQKIRQALRVLKESA